MKVKLLSSFYFLELDKLLLVSEFNSDTEPEAIFAVAVAVAADIGRLDYYLA